MMVVDHVLRARRKISAVQWVDAAECRLLYCGPSFHAAPNRFVRNAQSVNGSSGFTLLELIVAISIAAILAAISIPSFVTSTRSNRGVADAGAMLALLNLARSTALQTDSTVSLCISTTTGTSPTCATGTGLSWDQGYLLFIDPNNNGTYDTGDTLLRTEVPLSKGSTITYATSAATPVALTTLGFSGLGQLVSSGNTNPQGHFDVKPSNTNTGERYVVVRQIGRAVVCPPTDSNCGP